MNGNWKWVIALHKKCMQDIEMTKDYPGVDVCTYDFWKAVLSSAAIVIQHNNIRKVQLMLSDFVSWYNKL